MDTEHTAWYVMAALAAVYLAVVVVWAVSRARRDHR